MSSCLRYSRIWGTRLTSSQSSLSFGRRAPSCSSSTPSLNSTKNATNAEVACEVNGFWSSRLGQRTNRIPSNPGLGRQNALNVSREIDIQTATIPQKKVIFFQGGSPSHTPLSECDIRGRTCRVAVDKEGYAASYTFTPTCLGVAIDCFFHHDWTRSAGSYRGSQRPTWEHWTATEWSPSPSPGIAPPTSFDTFAKTWATAINRRPASCGAWNTELGAS